MTHSRLPHHWVGVYHGWETYSTDPLPFLIELSPEKMKTHTLLIGATGCGKTNLLHHLIAQDIIFGHSFAVLDLRGDLVSAAIELCADRVDPEKVKIIDLREKERPFGFNPLYGAGEPYFRALNVLQAIATESESWGVQLAETLRNALLLLAEAQEPLTKLEAVLYDRAVRLSCLTVVRSESLLAFWQRYDDLSPERQASLAMPVLNKVSLLLSTSTLRRILGHSEPIDIRKHLDTKGSITLVSLAVDELHGSGRMMGNLLLSSICRDIFARVDQPESQRNPVRLYVDEFEHFGMSEFENILAEGRRFGFSLVLAHQTLAQLSPKMRSLILGNVGTKFVFRVGRDDAATLSKDLTGDGKLFDFTTFLRGQAVISQRGDIPFLIEVNEPIVRDVGALTPNAAAFRRDVFSFAPKMPDEDEPPQGGLAGARPSLPMPPTLKATEDWLCA